MTVINGFTLHGWESEFCLRLNFFFTAGVQGPPRPWRIAGAARSQKRILAFKVRIKKPRLALKRKK